MRQVNSTFDSIIYTIIVICIIALCGTIGKYPKVKEVNFLTLSSTDTKVHVTA